MVASLLVHTATCELDVSYALLYLTAPSGSSRLEW